MKRLDQIAPEDEGLGRPTIMDRALAADHGVRYVHLAAFAIDMDRVAEAAPAEDTLPMGWEVFLTEHYLLSEFEGPDSADLALLEDVCLSVLDAGPNERRLGSQICFAVYDAIARGVLPESLRPVFRSWRSPPRQLLAELATLWEQPESSARRCALHCLSQDMQPPFSPPTLEALQEFSDVSTSA